ELARQRQLDLQRRTLRAPLRAARPPHANPGTGPAKLSALIAAAIATFALTAAADATTAKKAPTHPNRHHAAARLADPNVVAALPLTDQAYARTGKKASTRKKTQEGASQQQTTSIAASTNRPRKVVPSSGPLNRSRTRRSVSSNMRGQDQLSTPGWPQELP